MLIAVIAASAELHDRHPNPDPNAVDEARATLARAVEADEKAEGIELIIRNLQGWRAQFDRAAGVASAVACANVSSAAQRDHHRDSNHLRCANLTCEMEGNVTHFGYARVSTDGQSLDAQIAALQAAGCARVFSEKIRGVRSDRPQLAKAVEALGAGDVLVVTRLDRLARSTRDLLNVLAGVVERGAGFRSLNDGWADSTTPHGRLMLTVLGGLAEFERELIKARTAEGRARARAQGVRFGRKPKLTPHQRAEAIRRREAGETLVDIARTFNVSHSTICRL